MRTAIAVLPPTAKRHKSCCFYCTCSGNKTTSFHTHSRTDLIMRSYPQDTNSHLPDMSLSTILPYFFPLPTISPIPALSTPIVSTPQQLLTDSILPLATASTTSRTTPGCGQTLPYLPGSPTQNLTILTNDGLHRSYLLHIPLSYDIRTPAPLIFAFHGRTRTAAGMERLTGFSDAAVNQRAVVVYPQGVDVSLLFRASFLYLYDAGAL